jgi:hypothetical protein
MGSFKNLLKNYAANFNQTWHNLFLGVEDSSFQMKGNTLFQGEIIAKG